MGHQQLAKGESPASALSDIIDHSTQTKLHIARVTLLSVGMSLILHGTQLNHADLQYVQDSSAYVRLHYAGSCAGTCEHRVQCAHPRVLRFDYRDSKWK